MARGKEPGTFYFHNTGLVHVYLCTADNFLVPPRLDVPNWNFKSLNSERVNCNKEIGSGLSIDFCAVGDNHAAGRTLTVSRTVAPSLASMSISASVLKRSIRPRRRSLTRGWVTPSILAAVLCLRPRDSMSFCTWIMRSARTSRCSASSRRNPKSRNTFPVDGVIFSFKVFLPSPALTAQCCAINA